MMPELFDELRTNPTRALQCYQILISLAHERKTATYGMIANIIGFGGSTPLARILGHIMYWCTENDLPPLTVLIVNQETGLPGDGLSEANDFNADREKVFNYDWFGLVPPTPKQLEKAFKEG